MTLGSTDEILKQLILPSQIHDFNIHAVVFAQGIRSDLFAVQFLGSGQFISSEASEQSMIKIKVGKLNSKYY